MSTLLASINNKPFLVFGRAGMDIYPDPTGTRTSEVNNFFSCLGGSSANIAVALVRLGATADLVTSVSDDAIGWYVLKQLQHYGVGHTHVRKVVGEMRTSLAVVESRVEEHQSVIYRNNAADFCVETTDFADIDFQKYGALVATGTTLASEPSASSTLHAFQLARQAGLPIVLDMDYRPYSWASPAIAAASYANAVAQCGIVVGNNDEFAVITGDQDSGLEYAKNLAHTSDTMVIYKMGEKGSITFTKDETIKTGIFSVTPLKPTGAGDAFLGAFLASLAQGQDLSQCIVRGSAAAAIVVTKVGCAPAMPNADELNEFIQTHRLTSFS